jgi:geranylgeranyl pyrophosphate synthase
VAHGEAAAILAAFALLTRAFGILAGEGDATATPDRIRALIARRAADAIGSGGLIGGQCADLALSRPGSIPGIDPQTIEADLDTLESIHARKTGSLFVASAEIGALLGGATAEELEALRAYARNLGLAFQITDDLIDAIGDASIAGKPVRADAPRGSFATLSGIDGARTLAAELTGAALAAIAPFGRRGDRLRALAEHLAVRDR